MVYTIAMISKDKGRIILTLPLWQIEFIRKLADGAHMSPSEYFEKVFIGHREDSDSDDLGDN